MFYEDFEFTYLPFDFWMKSIDHTGDRHIMTDGWACIACALGLGVRFHGSINFLLMTFDYHSIECKSTPIPNYDPIHFSNICLLCITLTKGPKIHMLAWSGSESFDHIFNVVFLPLFSNVKHLFINSMFISSSSQNAKQIN